MPSQFAVPAFITRAYEIAAAWCDDGNGFTFRVMLTNGSVVNSPPSPTLSIKPQDGYIEFDTDDGTALVPFTAILRTEAVYVPGRDA